ncbi:12 kDa unknown protein [Oyster mushroom spherical virus]|uniref:12 kDa unknown protein n=1 Tax=Oyster mushroom spherical virus TaxID=218667 RepID=UPI0000005CCB|nr:12 kDa unknown protein [Oyster mushroom spherical virus]AAO26219.1 12 kDa unknown protein [Oyster mushroom spherical virus]
MRFVLGTLHVIPISTPLSTFRTGAMVFCPTDTSPLPMKPLLMRRGCWTVAISPLMTVRTMLNFYCLTARTILSLLFQPMAMWFALTGFSMPLRWFSFQTSQVCPISPPPGSLL